MKQVGIYLAGAIRLTPEKDRFLEEDCAWRTIVSRAVSMTSSGASVIFNPMIGESPKPNVTESRTMCGGFSLEPNALLQQDLALITRADIVFANLLTLDAETRYPHIGTLTEIGVSIVQRKLLVVLANNPAVSKHPFIQGGATRVLSTLDDGVDYLRGLIRSLAGSH